MENLKKKTLYEIKNFYNHKIIAPSIHKTNIHKQWNTFEINKLIQIIIPCTLFAEITKVKQTTTASTTQYIGILEKRNEKKSAYVSKIKSEKSAGDKLCC